MCDVLSCSKYIKTYLEMRLYNILQLKCKQFIKLFVTSHMLPHQTTTFCANEFTFIIVFSLSKSHKNKSEKAWCKCFLNLFWSFLRKSFSYTEVYTNDIFLLSNIELGFPLNSYGLSV
jgi:hypothetical protein